MDMEISNPGRLRSRIDGVKESRLFYKIVTLVAVGMFLDAIDVYLAGAVASSILKTHWSTLQTNSYFLSSGFLGLFIGSIASGIIGDVKGRKFAYQINLLLFGIFTILCGLAPNVYALIFCRFMASIGLGSEIVTGYSMINEFAPVKRRGKWCAIVSLVANAGAPITMVAASFIIPNFGWQVMFQAIGVVAIILWYLRRNIPESPRWLIEKGRLSEATAVIDQMNPAEGTATSSTPVQKTEPRAPKSIAKNLMVAIVAVSATIVCQYTFSAWVPTLLVRNGINIGGSLWASALMMVGAPVGCAIGAILIDRIGRKWTIIPAFFISAGLGLIYAHQQTMVGTEIIGFLMNVCFYILMASVVAVYVSELFPTAFRFRGVGISNGISKLLTVAMPIVVSWLLATTSSTAIFVIITIISVVAGLIVWGFGAETNQKQIE